VTALPLAPAPAVEFLGACLDRQALAPGVVVGATLAYWVAASASPPRWRRENNSCPIYPKTTGRGAPSGGPC
jgi:hypothetical protein